MELFTLGADRGAYTETDVRELARALTGWRADWDDTEGLHNFRFDTTRWDSGSKTVFGRTGAFTWEDACSAGDRAPAARVVLRRQALELLRPDPAARRRRRRARAGLRGLGAPDPPGARGDPALAAALRGPADGQAAGRPARGHAARAAARTITGEEWVWLAEGAGQRLYHPPDVAGWDDKRWLDSNTIRARWDLVNYVVSGRTIGPSSRRRRELPGRDRRPGARRRARVLARPAAGAETRSPGCAPTPSSSSRPPTRRAPRPPRASSAPACAPSARTPSVT